MNYKFHPGLETACFYDSLSALCSTVVSRRFFRVCIFADCTSSLSMIEHRRFKAFQIVTSPFFILHHVKVNYLPFLKIALCAFSFAIPRYRKHTPLLFAYALLRLRRQISTAHMCDVILRLRKHIPLFLVYALLRQRQILPAHCVRLSEVAKGTCHFFLRALLRLQKHTTFYS